MIRIMGSCSLSLRGAIGRWHVHAGGDKTLGYLAGDRSLSMLLVAEPILRSFTRHDINNKIPPRFVQRVVYRWDHQGELIFVEGAQPPHAPETRKGIGRHRW